MSRFASFRACSIRDVSTSWVLKNQVEHLDGSLLGLSLHHVDKVMFPLQRIAKDRFSILQPQKGKYLSAVRSA